MTPIFVAGCSCSPLLQASGHAAVRRRVVRGLLSLVVPFSCPGSVSTSPYFADLCPGEATEGGSLRSPKIARIPLPSRRSVRRCRPHGRSPSPYRDPESRLAPRNTPFGSGSQHQRPPARRGQAARMESSPSGSRTVAAAGILAGMSLQEPSALQVRVAIAEIEPTIRRR